MKKILFIVMIACLTLVCTINANVSSAVSSASYYELEKVEENEYGENFTFVRENHLWILSMKMYIMTVTVGNFIDRD